MSNMTPPGWYPDSQNPSQQRWWNGTAWTEHTAPTNQRPQWGGAAALGATSTPKQNSAPNLKIISVGVGAVVAFFGVIAIVFAVSGSPDPESKKSLVSDETSNSPTPESTETKSEEPEASPTPTPKPTPTPTPTPEPEPSMQDRFVSIVDEGRNSAEDADNEIGVVQARKERATALCGLLPPSLAVRGWTGEVEDVSTELGGDAGVLAITLTDEIAVQTWNNSFSDMDSDTLISPSSPMYEVMAGLSEGDSVTFAGNFISDRDKCLQEQSLMDESGMATPDFSFKFSSVRKN